MKPREEAVRTGMPCPSLVNLAVIAENYGQMTGVLAGFAFTALVLLLTPTQSDQRLATGRQGEGVPLAFLVAFMALVISTLLYSVLAGEPEGARPRAATVELIDGFVFGLAVLILLQGVSLLMHSANIERSAVIASRILTVVVIPALAMYFIAQGASDTLAARDAIAGRACRPIVPVLGIWLTVALAVTLAGALLPGVQKPTRKFAAFFRVAAPSVIFIATVIAAIAAGYIHTKSPTFLMSPVTLKIFLVSTFLFLAAVGLMLAFSEIIEPRNPGNREADSDLPSAT